MGMHGRAPLSQLALVYDHICFEEDHGDELEAYDGSGDVLTEIMVYDYPGGPLAMEDSFQVDVEENPLSQYFEYLYTDEERPALVQVGLLLWPAQCLGLLGRPHER